MLIQAHANPTNGLRAVCKTSIHGFKSHPVLQRINKIEAIQQEGFLRVAEMVATAELLSVLRLCDWEHEGLWWCSAAELSAYGDEKKGEEGCGEQTLEDGAHAEGVTEFLFIRASDVSTANGRTLLSRLVSILSASRSMG
jgi:hypothetical protein